MPDKAGMIPKSRLDALTDGVFAFAMTLLVLNLQLPEDFKPSGADDLLQALRRLSEPLLAYVISFYVLARRWTGQASARQDPEAPSDAYAWAVLHHLFFITLMPFSTLVAGEYARFAPAVWLYGANTIAAAVAAILISRLAEREGRPDDSDARLSLSVLIGTALLSILVSLFNPGLAMWAYLLNFATPLIGRLLARQP